MEKRTLPLMLLLFLLVIAIACEDHASDKALPDVAISVSVSEPLRIADDVIHVSVLGESRIEIDYAISAAGTIKQLTRSLGGVEEVVDEAIGKEVYADQVTVDIPFETGTILLELKATDVHDQVATETISIVVDASGEFAIEGDVAISGSVRQGAEIVISGSGFGSGPNVVLYDDFNGGKHQEPIPLNSPVIGTWAAKSSPYSPRYHQYAYSGKTSFAMEDDLAAVATYGKKNAQLKARFEDTQEVFISYQLAVPPDKFFPGAPSRDQWGEGSHWKLTWLMDGDEGFGHADGKADLCVPTNGQAQSLQIGGNTDWIGWVGSLDDLFDMDGFNRVTVWIRAEPLEPETKGYTWIQWLSARTGPAFTRAHDKPVFNGGATAPTSHQWNQLNVPGWYGNSLVNPGGVYDDVYLATGENAAARVEIGDAERYDECRTLSILPSLSWTDTEIKAIVKAKAEETISKKYLFIFDGKNRLIKGGIAIP